MKNLTIFTAILLATTTFAQIPNYVPTNGLVGWWPFNGNANDESGNGNNGTVNGATLTSDRNGSANKAYSFDGVNDYISVNSNTQFVSQTLTINVIIKPLVSQEVKFIEVGNSNSSNWSIYTQNNFAFGFRKNESCVGFSQNQFLSQINNEWIHLIIVTDSLQTKLYKNGVLLNIIPSTNFNSSCPLSNMNIGLDILGQQEFWNGLIDDIGIWNRALTACEIKDLYNSQLGSSNTTSSQTQPALDTYTWPVNNQTYTQSGTYSDTLVNAAGCDSIVTLNLTLSYTGINELNASQLVVSPNPTKDNFSISGLELLGTITSLEIKDASGKVVKVLNPTTTNFSCVGLKAAVYFLAITSNKTEQVIKIIKE
jgi:hypothetical protein